MHLIRTWSFTQSREICTETDIKLWHRMFILPHNIIQGLYSTNYKSFPFSWSSCLFIPLIVSFSFKPYIQVIKNLGHSEGELTFLPLFLYFEVFLINEIYGWGLIWWGFGAVLFYCSHSRLPLSLLFLMNWTFYLQEFICSVDHRKCQMLPNCISTSKLATIIFISIFKASTKCSGKERSIPGWEEHTKSHQYFKQKKVGVVLKLKMPLSPCVFLNFIL